MNYKKFCKGPLNYIKRMSGLINEDSSDVINLVDRNEVFLTNHLIASNRLKILSQITIKPSGLLMVT